MLAEPMKAVLAVGLIALMLGSASLLLVTADSHGAGGMTKLEPGAQHWYTLAYPGSGTVEVRMDVDPAGGAAFMIVTPEAVRAWEAGAELIATGRGANNPNEGADLFWSGSFGQAGDYHLIVEYSGDGTAPSSYSLEVSGAEVSSDVVAEAGPAGADGLWCYTTDMAWAKPIDYPAPPTGKAFLSTRYQSEWSGFLTGASEDTGLIIAHGPAPMLFEGTSSFADAEVGGLSGGLELDALGYRTDPTAGWWGWWSISGGSGDLTDLRAHGTFWGAGWYPGVETDECPPNYGVIYYSVDG